MIKYIHTVAYICIKERKLLEVLTRGNKTYYMPGGKIDEGEDNLTALLRELKEELAITIVPDTVKLYKVYEAQAHGKPKGIIVRMSCYMGSYKGKLQPSREIVDYHFFSEEEYRLTEDPAPIGIIINADLKKAGLID